MDYPIVLRAYYGNSGSLGLIQIDPQYINERMIILVTQYGDEVDSTPYQVTVDNQLWIQLPNEDDLPIPVSIKYEDEDSIPLKYFNIPEVNIVWEDATNLYFNYLPIPGDELLDITLVDIENGGELADYIPQPGTTQIAVPKYLIKALTEDYSATVVAIRLRLPGEDPGIQDVFGYQTNAVRPDYSFTASGYMRSPEELVIGSSRGLPPHIIPSLLQVEVSIDSGPPIAAVFDEEAGNYWTVNGTFPDEEFSVEVFVTTSDNSAPISLDPIPVFYPDSLPVPMFKDGIGYPYQIEDAEVYAFVTITNLDEFDSIAPSDGVIYSLDGNTFAVETMTTFTATYDGAEPKVYVPEYYERTSWISQLKGQAGWVISDQDGPMADYLDDNEEVTTVIDGVIDFNSDLVGIDIYPTRIYQSQTMATSRINIPEYISDASFLLTLFKAGDDPGQLTSFPQEQTFGVPPVIGGEFTQSDGSETIMTWNDYRLLASVETPVQGTAVFYPEYSGVDFLRYGYLQIPSTTFDSFARNPPSETPRLGFRWPEPTSGIFSVSVFGSPFVTKNGSYYVFAPMGTPTTAAVVSSQPYANVDISTDLPSYENMYIVPAPEISITDTGILVTSPGPMYNLYYSINGEPAEEISFGDEPQEEYEITDEQLFGAETVRITYSDENGFVSYPTEMTATQVEVTAQNTYENGVWTTVITTSPQTDTEDFQVSVNGTQLTQVSPGIFTTLLDLPPGTYNVTVVAPNVIGIVFSPTAQNNVVIPGPPSPSVRNNGDILVPLAIIFMLANVAVGIL